jgi:hypothetical protein
MAKDPIAAEKTAWEDLLTRATFLSELSSAKTDPTLTKDASNKLLTSIAAYRPLLKERLEVEFKK